MLVLALNGCSLNAVDCGGSTALHLCAVEGHARTACVVLKVSILIADCSAVSSWLVIGRLTLCFLRTVRRQHQGPRFGWTGIPPSYQTHTHTQPHTARLYIVACGCFCKYIADGWADTFGTQLPIDRALENQHADVVTLLRMALCRVGCRIMSGGTVHMLGLFIAIVTTVQLTILL